MLVHRWFAGVVPQALAYPDRQGALRGVDGCRDHHRQEATPRTETSEDMKFAVGDLASRWRPQPAVGGPSQPRRVAKF